MAKISVIVPVYGVEKYLREAIDSLLKQTLSDIEKGKSIYSWKV